MQPYPATKKTHGYVRGATNLVIWASQSSFHPALGRRLCGGQFAHRPCALRRALLRCCEREGIAVTVDSTIATDNVVAPGLGLGALARAALLAEATVPSNG